MYPQDAITHDHHEPLTLQGEEVELLSGELDALIEAMPVDRRDPYRKLAEVVANGNVVGQNVETLERVLELLLASGRTRQAHRAEGERMLEGLYSRTPRGRMLREVQDQTNRALRALEGRRIDGMRVRAAVSGRHTITVATDGLQLTLVADRNGVHIDKVTL